MSLALFGLVLLVIAVLLAWKKPRPACAVVVGVLLGIVIAASNGGMAGTSHHLVDAIRSDIDSVATWVMS